jgi:hypothetical protein
MRERDASDLVDHFIDIVLSHQLALILLDPDAQQCRLSRDAPHNRSARRLLPLTPQVRKYTTRSWSSGKASPCRWITPSASSLPVGAGAIEVQRPRRRADADRGRETGLATGATVSVSSTSRSFLIVDDKHL